MPEFTPEGPRDARIFLAGESLGVEEVESGNPFCGPAGRVLDKGLYGARIPRASCRIDNLFHFMPPSDPAKKTAIFEERFPAARAALVQRINECGATIVVPIGDWALRAVVGENSITKWRGSILECASDIRTRKAVPILHPAFIMRGNWSWLNVTITDLKRVAAESLSSLLVRDTDRFVMHLSPTFSEAIDFLRGLDHKRPVSVDIETRNRQVACQGFAQGDEAMCIPIHAYGHLNNCYWTIEEEEAIWREVGAVLGDPSIEKIFQNYMYDAFYYRLMGIAIRGHVWDTMLMHHCLYHEFWHRLEFLTSIYTTIPYYKDDGKEWNPKQPNEKLWRYNCLDVLAPVIIKDRLQAELNERHLLPYYNEWYTDLLNPYLDMSLHGILRDDVLRVALKTATEELADTLQAEFTLIVGTDLNVRSSKQMANYFYGERGLPVQKIRKTGKATFNKTARAKLLRQNPLMVELQLAGKIAKLKDRISDLYNKHTDHDGCIRSTWNLGGTDTGRTSSSSCPLWTGTNLQNPEREKSSSVREALKDEHVTRIQLLEARKEDAITRSIYIPTPGHIFINGDLEQAEARLVAALAQELVLLNHFEQHEDVYRWLAGQFRGVDPKKMEKKDPWRQIFKQVAHASHYGMQKNKLVDLLAEQGIYIGAREAQGFIDWYHRTCPNIRSVFHAEVEYRIRTTRKLTNLLGRERLFFGLIDDEMFRKGYAYIPQGTVSDVIKIAMKRLHGRWPVVQEGHDSLLLEVLREDEAAATADLDAALTYTLKVKGYELTIPREIKTAESWGGLTYAERTHLTTSLSTHAHAAA